MAEPTRIDWDLPNAAFGAKMKLSYIGSEPPGFVLSVKEAGEVEVDLPMFGADVILEILEAHRQVERLTGKL